MPVLPPPSTSTSTRVVAFHSSVPSDSGVAVGMAKADTCILAMHGPLSLMCAGMVEISILCPLSKDLLDRLLDDPSRIRIAFKNGRGIGARLLERYMRRQRRHIRVGINLKYHRPVCTHRIIPRSTEFFRLVDAQAAQADQFCIGGIGEIGYLLRRLEFRIALHRPLFPGHLIQVAIIEDHYDKVRIA